VTGCGGNVRTSAPWRSTFSDEFLSDVLGYYRTPYARCAALAATVRQRMPINDDAIFSSTSTAFDRTLHFHPINIFLSLATSADNARQRLLFQP